jgi:hypothetical protein
MRHHPFFRRAGALLLTLAMSLSLALPVSALDDPDDPGDVVDVDPPADVAVTGITLSSATLLLSVGGTATLTAAVSPDSVADKTVIWTSDDASDTVATVDATGLITAKAPGEITVTATAKADESRFASCKVTVSGLRLTDRNGDPVPTLTLDTSQDYDLNYLRFGEAQDSSSILWTSSNSAVVSVSGGRLYSRAEGTATITASAGNYSDQCIVTVREDPRKIVTRSLTAGESLSFSALRTEFSSMCTALTPSQAALSYLSNLSVATGQGVLYYGYVSPADPGVGVGATERYYLSPSASGQRGLNDITFLPASGFEGTATVRFTGYNTEGESFSGQLRLTMADSDNIGYATAQGTAVPFSAADFSAVCLERGGRELSYVTFTLPAASYGTLYYNYITPSQYAERVVAGSAYYRTRSPYLDQVSFLPADGYTGTVQIAYRAVDTAGNAYTGKVVVTVSNSSLGSGNVAYSGYRDESIQFAAADFSTACQSAIGETLSYVCFDLPASGQGTLYSKYGTSSSAAVSGSTRYYRTSLSNISFLPASGADDVVTISFTAYGTSGGAYDGQVRITLLGNTSRTVQIVYLCLNTETRTFSSGDFNTACRAAHGSSLNSLQFDTLPSTAQGTLYYNYSSASNPGTKVTTTVSYYRTGSSRLLDNVTFVPASGYQGTVTIPFTCKTISGDSYQGQVTVQVSSPVAETLQYYTTSLPLTLSASDLQRVCAGKTGRNLVRLFFTSLPDTASGRLYAGYTGLGTGIEVTTGTSYYDGGYPSLDQLVFVPKAGFSGQATLTYTGVDSSGASYTGTVLITVTPGTVSTRFYDMGSYSWAVPAVDFLAQSGVVNGVTSNQFCPGQPISRGAFVTMVCRAFQFPASTAAGSFPDVVSGSYYAQSVATAKALGIVVGSNGQFLPGQPLTRQAAFVMLYRAMVAAGRAPAVSPASLSAFSDANQVSDYARDAVSVMVQLGVVKGSGGQLRPTAAISRAEMAVVLYRVLTL